MVVLFIFMVINNIYATENTKNNLKASNQKAADLYVKQIENSFDSIESFLLLQTIDNNDYYVVMNSKRYIDKYRAIYNIQDQYVKAITGYKMVDSFFMYYQEENLFIDAIASHISGEEHNEVTMSLKNAMQKYNIYARENFEGWMQISVNGNYYLVRLLKLNELYIGSWVNVENLLGPFYEYGYANAEHIFFTNKRGIPLSNKIKPYNVPLDIIKSEEQEYINFKENEYLAIVSHTEKASLYLTLMIKKDYVMQDLKTLNNFMLLIIIVASLIIIGMAFVLRQLLFNPLNKMVYVMNKLKAGNLNVKLEDKKACEEFKIINKTFDDMIEQIEKLKIDVYEQKIKKQKTQLQYLQQQINPHFMINCLNLIRSLAIFEETEKIQDVTITLSQYMRYTLHSGTLVSIKEEREHIENYIKLQQLRYKDGLNYIEDIDSKFENVLLPTMSIQTFVDNAVKYQMVAGEKLDIKVTLIIIDNGFMKIEIKDSGDGFDKDILYRLREDKKIKSGIGEHIGIYNVKQRLLIIYGAKASIKFDNCDPDKDEGYTGAKIEMIIPIEYME